MINSRTKILLGKEKTFKLEKSTVAVFGIGGVGGYAVEALIRAGIKKIYIFDYDKVSESNINRQILALNSSLGRLKVDVARERIFDINPLTDVVVSSEHLLPENINSFIPDDLDFAIDAIDEISSKLSLIETLYKKNIPFISSMGAGNRTDTGKIFIDDISKTAYCPLAKKVRKELKKRDIYSGVICVFSTEQITKTGDSKKIGSISFLPGIFGLRAAGYAIDYLINH